MMSREKKKTYETEIKNLNRTIARAIKKIQPPEQISVSEWADRYRKLSSENTAEAGRWKTSRTPYLEEIMNAFKDPHVHRETVVSSSQTGKTECELNMLGYAIDQDPGGIMFIMPTVDVAKDFSKRRLAPMIRDTERLRNKIAEAKSRDGDNTVLKKSYPGGMLTLVGSNAPAPLAGTPARYVFGDERDRWAEDAGGEGDPWKLAEARTITFYNYKMVEVSTPTIKGNSAIVSSFDKGTQEYWCVECPHCHEYVFIEFEHIMYKFNSTKINHKTQYMVENAEFACPECGCASSEETIKKQPHKWVAKNPDAYKNGARSFWINAFSSPWIGWKTLVLRYLEAKGDPNELKTVYNTLFGKLWDGETYVDDDTDGWLGKREDYEAELPDGVLCLTCGVDTQDNRLEYEVVGYGFEGENWGIERGVIIGKPDKNDTWERLDGIIDRVYRFKDGKGLRVSITFVDSGGHYTQDVYIQCAKRINKRVFAIKGKDGADRPYTDVPRKTKIIKENRVLGEVWFYLIGVDSGKTKIMSALSDESEQKNHFPANPDKGYNATFFNGLLSEQTVYRNKKWRWEKIPGHNRNEALDCRNYANAAYDALKPNLHAIYKRLKETGTRQQKKVTVKRQQKRRRVDDADEW